MGPWQRDGMLACRIQGHGEKRVTFAFRRHVLWRQVKNDSSVAAHRNRALSSLSIMKCLEHFLQREQLDESEMWYCSNCKASRSSLHRSLQRLKLRDKH